MTLLFPRLSLLDAKGLWEALFDLSVEELDQRANITHSNQYFAAVGGTRVNPKELQQLSDRIRLIAADCGFPDRLSLREFDTRVAIFFGEDFLIPLGEALRKETWSFISLVLLPDIVKWRFKDFNIARCTGGRRDCFQRLWLRARAFDLGENAHRRWMLVEELTEDFYVSVLERPTLAGNPDICRALGLAWLSTAHYEGRGRMENINRRAIKLVRSEATLLFIDALDNFALSRMTERCYQQALRDVSSIQD